MKSFISTIALVASLTEAAEWGHSRPAYGYRSPAPYGGYGGRGGYGGYGGRGGYGYGAPAYGHGGYGAGPAYGPGYGPGPAYGPGYGPGPAYGPAPGYGPGPAYGPGYGNGGYGGYGYGAPAYGHGGYGYKAPIGDRAYAYRPHAAPRDYGLWKKSYKLDVETFEQTVVKDTENVWVVAFIDPACGYCKKLSVQWEKLKTVETIKVRRVRFGYVDITLDVSKKIVQKYAAGQKIEYTPSVLLYGQDKHAPTAYDGDYSADSLNGFVCGYCDKQGFSHHGHGHGYGYDAPKVVGTARSHTNKVSGKSNYKRSVKDVEAVGGYGGYGNGAYGGYGGYGGYGDGYGNDSYGNGYGNGGYGGYGNGYGRGGYGGYGRGGYY